MIQKPKGTYDVYGDMSTKILYIEKILNELMKTYNYEYFRTPLFESTELFHRGVGDTTDIVTKETYDFKDRGDRNMTLRPEGTAGIARLYVENKLYANPAVPVKCWYYGPMYRYERPQSGRYREFYQFGVEVFGSVDPMIDAEVISIPVTIYQLLGLKGLKVKVNSLGDKESRDNYREALKAYFRPYLDDLCEDCRARFEKNSLRILDCKVDHNKEYFMNAPRMIDYLNETSKKHFEDVLKYLDAMNIDYEVDPSIVRGLDYYNHTVFEVEADIKGFGSQNVLCGGGRYEELVETIGGPKTSGIGFALGLERLLSALECENVDFNIDNSVDVYVIPMDDAARGEALSLTYNLRLNGFKTDTDFMGRNLKGNFKQADRLNAKYLVFVGEEEINTRVLTVRDNSTKEEYKLSLDDFVSLLDEKLEH